MIGAMKALIAELEQEAVATRRLLERVPEEKLSWRPHEKSMSLGQLAFHIATTPGVFVIYFCRMELMPAR